jgi:dipeptidyl aminopeptidase/acylaminoacyl peptidase
MTWDSTQEAAQAAFETVLRLKVPTNLRLSPDGNTLAFVLPIAATAVSDGDGGGSLVHLLQATGSDVGLSRPLSDPRLNASLPRWSGDGRLVVVAGAFGGGEHNTLLALDRETGDVLWTQPVEGAIEDLVVLGNIVVARVADPGSERDGMHLGLRVHDDTDPWVTRPGRRWRRLVVAEIGKLGTRSLSLPGWTVWDFDVSPDGQVLAVVSEDPRPAGYYSPTLLRTDLDGLAPTVLLRSRRQLSRPRLSLDGRDAWVIEGRSIVSGRVLRVTLSDGSVKEVKGLDDVTDLGVLPDDRVWFTGWAGVGVQTGVLVDGLVKHRWESPGSLGGPDGQPGLTIDQVGTTAFAVWEDGTHPPEIVSAPLSGLSWQPRSTIYADLASLTVGTSREQVHWESPDGTMIHGLLLRPAGAAGNLPLVVMVHGGPTWLWSDAFAPGESNGLAVPLALAGAAVLLPNPRGSSGRGRAYSEAVLGRVGDVDLPDLLSGVDALVDRGVADPTRMAIMGLSYGGYMAAWAITQTNRFRAAVVMSGVSDWLSFSQSSNLAGGYDRMYHCDADASTPLGREALANCSPAHHADSAHTPTLVLHGAEDRVTPVGQAEQLYTAWAAAGIDVELVIYPREGHELVEAAHRRDATRRVFDWLHEHGVLG